jgi:hypothetical protein
MVYVDLRCCVVFIVVNAVNASMIFFICFAFLHGMVLGAMRAYHNPETFLGPVIIFATFVAVRNAQVVTTVKYMPAYFKFSVHQAFSSFRIHF